MGQICIDGFHICEVGGFFSQCGGDGYLVGLEYYGWQLGFRDTRTVVNVDDRGWDGEGKTRPRIDIDLETQSFEHASDGRMDNEQEA